MAQNNTMEKEDLGNLQAERLRKLNELKAMGIDPYPYNFKRSHECAELQEKYKDLADEERTEDIVTVAGRVHNQRNDWMFVDLYDVSGRIQLFSELFLLSRTELKQCFEMKIILYFISHKSSLSLYRY